MSRVRVLVVDDSVVVRRIVSDVLAADPRIEVVGVAANGRLAQAKVEQLQPDLVTMDVEMPEMDGIEAVAALRAAGHRMPVVMFSTLTERGAIATLDALAAGATDYVTKPHGTGSVAEALARVARELVPKIIALVPRDAEPVAPTGRPLPRLAAPRAATGAPATAAPARRPLREPAPHPVQLVVVGSSTGGPEALSRLLRGFTTPPRVPVLVVQHMPPVFTRQLAARLDRLGPTTVVEAAHDEPLRPGHVYIAPGDRHLVVDTRTGMLRTALTDAPPINFCRPAVDVLFRSAVKAVRGEILAVVLTGMGADGRDGCADVVEAGGTVLVQDRATSVVWGMPGAVAAAGLAHRVLPIDDVAGAVQDVLSARGTDHRSPDPSGAPR
ncbi:protein-glutamate methylesterase/protein-glutamine glutaminase [Cellulomonas fimi]|uniref:Protein-glutamate methylesterase/protein-glutamine glutaminase n=1 Tax=Cellulomonas fimi (strain ATCC 484 / DSM 20113 / JCM 1341 / CCUG 24087 / LMG 16345 / NBRC 15513 / NCIMB 8980 / NCTC 7547 / NRS-133) TaxID=590998 RepID=F4GZC7_CELFA|nr:chemotaxis response regulator protein-glutamate methylesterase [Cellulomonas fimi]AEE44848.1 response regulator receiver modulated CheB methylesterase [Cellulomonas fimi ATCC 484]NNH08084.1 chemotaxis response regulator protein-glutamate methylesterase [Cellulomonas fimi]VEH27470.1 Chemotaxis response regulator protein-glutamate methylesterase [Cellulomonas fimi]